MQWIRLAAACSLLWLCGCSSLHDPRIAAAGLQPLPQAGVLGHYANASSYLSQRRAYFGGEQLGNLFGHFDKQIASVTVAIVADGNLQLRFLADDARVLHEVVLREGEQFQRVGGRIVIRSPKRCDSGEAAVGCEWSALELSATAAGDLAVVKKGGGVALIGLVVPTKSTYSYLAVYPAWRGDTPPAGNDAR